MNENEPNKILKGIKKEFDQLKKDSGGMSDRYDWDKDKKLKLALEVLINSTGAIGVLSKKNIILLVAMQGTHRVMPEHRFYMAFQRELAED